MERLRILDLSDFILTIYLELRHFIHTLEDGKMFLVDIKSILRMS